MKVMSGAAARCYKGAHYARVEIIGTIYRWCFSPAEPAGFSVVTRCVAIYASDQCHRSSGAVEMGECVKEKMAIAIDPAIDTQL